MAAAFKVLPQVEIKKCFFGLSTSMTYQKTNSKIHIIQNEYDASNGKLLETPSSPLLRNLSRWAFLPRTSRSQASATIAWTFASQTTSNSLPLNFSVS